MSSFDRILDAIKDEALDFAKDEFKVLLARAKADSNDLVKENAAKIVKWLKMIAEGDLDKDEFNALIDSQKRVVEQYLTTLEIQARARSEKITMGLINIAVGKIVPALIP